MEPLYFCLTFFLGLLLGIVIGSVKEESKTEPDPAGDWWKSEEGRQKNRTMWD